MGHTGDTTRTTPGELAGAGLTPASPVRCAGKFRSLAALFRGPSPAAEDAVRALLTPCADSDGHEQCPLFEADYHDAGQRALLWFEHVGTLAVLEAEHSRLFSTGGPLAPTWLPRLSPCAAAHLEGDADSIIESVSMLYRDLGFTTPGAVLRPACPCHIANELDFLAHCLEVSERGLPGASEAACRFLSDHLFAWAIVLGAAVSAVAEHPVTRFAGIALESLLFCEHAARFDRRYDHAPPLA